jgi:hypothetical protein
MVTLDCCVVTQAHQIQLAEGFAYCSAADVELLTKLSFRGKRIARLESTIHNLGHQELFQLKVKRYRALMVEAHGRPPPGRA